MNKKMSTSLIMLLAAVFAMSPFAIDSYLPAIPAMAADLNIETSMVSVTVSIYVLGMAIGQLFGGPLSDRFGRRPIMVAGLLIFSVGSLLIASAESMEMLWSWRVIQSIGGGVAVVGVPATIRDNAEGKEAARLFSLVALIMMLAPSIAPTVGTIVLKTLGWPSIFIILSVVAVVVAVGAAVVMPKAEKVTKQKKSGGYISVIKERRALGYLLAQAFGYAVLMTFITNAPFAYIEHFEVTVELFSGLFIVNVVGIVIVNRANSLLLRVYEPAILLKAFLGMQLIGGVTLVGSMIIAPENLWFAVVGFVISIAANGGIMSNSSACFMRFFANSAGVASALLGAVQYGVGAAVSALAAMLSVDTLWPMILAMLVSTLIALTGAFVSSRSELESQQDARSTEIEHQAK
ncbi:multidrug effflux MFS transporter [Photobacterium chitinilyticum]|uniref:Bcr/CflA family efflux transporter n=1 Tax=Photobacterium chitinilyticum TaxID=2485123 RepID=A0A3S3R881_9GAMM|nr:multidrug effflux MFS transporter [Photobacterium chitinilyticum]RWX54688.1 Bcr/CflA family efflux MFS transporter [Photobacterium chitinilyticum]